MFYNEINILEETIMNNKGIFGLVNYEDTPFEVKYSDGTVGIIVKSLAQGVIDGTLMIGAVAVVSGYARLFKK
uniref:Uncharacterized protein n=1 Tax=Caudovirus D_HF5_2C TaxID=3071196 RepID=A0AA96EJ59_9CAUD|nr:hypothetical protein [Caudovirus D_HF5_2C]